MVDIQYRTMSDADLPFLKQVYRSTREAELQMTGWPEVQKAAFIDMQFNAQHLYYQQSYGDAAYQVIVGEGKDIGRLYIWESETQIRIMDIALLPAARNKGIGTYILDGLIEEATIKQKRINIHVEHNSPALKLYERLGFRKVEDLGFYVFMERP